MDGVLGDGWYGAAETPEVVSVLNGDVPISALIKPTELKNWDCLQGMNHQIKFSMLDEFQKKDLWDDLSILKKHYQSIVIFVPAELQAFSFYLKQEIQGILIPVPYTMTQAIEMLHLLKKIQKEYQGKVFFMMPENEKSAGDFLKKEIEKMPSFICSFSKRYAL